MFELPEAKRVRRSDLYSPDSSPAPSEPDHDLSALLVAQLSSYYGTPPSAPQSPPLNSQDLPDADPGDVEEEEFEFRLFSTSKDAAPAKVVLENEEEDLGDGAFLRGRDPRYFFADGRKRGEYEAVAVSGEEILKGTEMRFWGLEVPWRVTVVKIPVEEAANVKKSTVELPRLDIMEGVKGKRKMPGKKRRLVLRSRAKVERELEAKKKEETDKRKAIDAEKEGREREKKSRKNKEKQARRRAKEKAEKAAQRGDADTGDADEAMVVGGS